jgi:chromosome segregation ATPase
VSAEKGMVGALDAFEVRLQHAEESAARAEAGIKPFEDRIKSLEARLSTAQNGAESAASAEAAVKLEDRIKSLEARLNTVQGAADSATSAEATVKSFEDRIKSLEIDRVQLNELSHNIEGLNLNLRSPRRQIIDCIPSRQLCDAQCKDEEVLVGGGCYVPTEGASGTPDSNGYGIVANSYHDN